MSHSDPASIPARPRHRWRWLPWLAATVCLAAIVPIRLAAHTFDFAVANVLTVLLSLLAWWLLVLALAFSNLPRWLWKVLLAMPLVGMLVFFSLFQFERVDGDLRPQFQSRWRATDPLPTVDQAGLEDSQAVAVLDADMRAARATDFPQFLGPHRNAQINSLTLATDWSATPPQIAWKRAIGDGWSSFAVQGDAAVTMEQRAEEEWISAYSVLDGRLLWTYVIPVKHANVMGGTGPRSTPTIDGEYVFACSAVSRVVCLELKSGRLVWMRELLEIAETNQDDFEREVAWGRSASPLLTDDKVIVPLGGVGDDRATLIALDRQTGKDIWRGGNDQISYSSPILATLTGVPQILLISESQLAAYDPQDGRQLWSTDWPGSSSGSASVSQPVVVDDSHVLLSKGYGEGAKYLQIEESDGTWRVETLWENSRVLRTKFTSCVVKDGYAYGLSDGILECVSLQSGERQWKNGRYRQGQLLLVGEHLLITTEAGQVLLVMADPSEFQEVVRFPVIGDITWNTPALSGNRLLMRNSDEAACVLLPLQQTVRPPTSPQNEQES